MSKAEENVVLEEEQDEEDLIDYEVDENEEDKNAGAKQKEVKK